MNTPAVRQLLVLVQSGHFKVLPVIESHAAQLVILLQKYERMDLGDGTRGVLSAQFPRAKIITVDTRDFPVYRRFSREPSR